MVKSANCYQDLEPTNWALSTIGFADRNQDIPMVYPDVPRLHSRKQAQPRDMRTLSGPGGGGGVLDLKTDFSSVQFSVVLDAGFAKPLYPDLGNPLYTITGFCF